MKLFRKIDNKLISIWVQIRDLYLYLFRHAIIVNGYVDDYTWHGIRHRNWGDDLNYYFLQRLTQRPIVIYNNFKLAKWLHLDNYMCIGTLLDTDGCTNKKTIVWGSGVSGLERDFVTPQRIYAVRGEKSKVFLERYHKTCPCVYGDPALLLPLVYNVPLSPKSQIRTYKLGIIPHVKDKNHPIFKEIRNQYADEILIVDLANYKKWTDVIDQIQSCEKILSSSLHGIIVSDAYQIPNCWITLSKKAIIGHFKFLDYFSSVNRKINDWVVIKTADDIFQTTFSCASKRTIKNIQRGLIQAAPFDIPISDNSIIDEDN